MGNMKFRPLKSKQVKELKEMMIWQWGAAIEGPYYFLKSEKDKIYLVDNSVGKINLDSLQVNSIGLYIAEVSNDEIRLSIEGSWLLGPAATKNVVEISEKEAVFWLKGHDVEKIVDANGFVILKHKNDFLGTGRATAKGILNFVPKSRRLPEVA